MAVTLCVLLWASDGHAAELIEYEDQVLGLIPEHGGTVIQRVRSAGTGADPFEVHILEFPSEQALDAYMKDDRRQALGSLRDQAIARTEVLHVEIL